MKSWWYLRMTHRVSVWSYFSLGFSYFCIRHSARSNKCQEKLLYKCICHIQGLPSPPLSLLCLRSLGRRRQSRCIFQAAWSTALLSVCSVLGQGLGSGQCCLAPLTLLCLVTKQADGVALVRVKHWRPSLYIKFRVDCREVWFSSHLWLGAG